MLMCTYSIAMTDLFTLDIMIGYVLPVQDEPPCLFPTVTLKLLNFSSLTVHSIPPSEQEELKRKFHSESTSGIRCSQNRIVFKKGKSCSFKLSEQDTQKLYIPLTITLIDAWYLPGKELASTCIDILVPHFKQGSVIPPINSSKQIYELCNTKGGKVAMIELSYKLKRVKTDVSNAVSIRRTKPEKASNKDKLEKSDAKEISFPQDRLRIIDNAPFNMLYDKLTICPPPLLYSASSGNEQKMQSEAEPVTSQDVSQVVWPNGYTHAEPGWNVPKDDFNTVLLPSCPENAALPIAQDEANVSNNHNFSILRALVKELSAMEQLLHSKGVSYPAHPVQKCSDVYVQTENLSSSEADDKLTPTKIVTKKLRGQQKKFTRECCVTTQDHSSFKQPRKVKCMHISRPPQDKITSPRIKSVHRMTSPKNKVAASSSPNKLRTRKLKIRSPPKQKPPPQIQLDSAVSQIPRIPSDKSDASEEFNVNSSVEFKGDQSKLNLEIHLPTVAMAPSVTAMSLKQDDATSSTSIINTVGLLTVPADSITPSVTPMGSTIPLTAASQTVTPLVSALALSPASQSVQLTQASSNDVQSYANLSLSESTEDVLNQSHMSNLVFSAKHLKAVLADDKSVTKDTSPTSDHDRLSNVDDNISPAESNESVQYKDDFESSECSSKETLSS